MPTVGVVLLFVNISGFQPPRCMVGLYFLILFEFGGGYMTCFGQ